MANSSHDNVDDLTNKLEGIQLQRSAKFVINPIIFVDGSESSESSSDEYSSSDEEYFNNCGYSDANFSFNQTNLPFRPFKITKDKITKGVGFLSENATQIVNLSDQSLRVVQNFIEKIINTGLEKNSKYKIKKVVSVSILLNRPRSISTRKNNLLEKKPNPATGNLMQPTHKIDYNGVEVKMFGLFWDFQWYDKNNKNVRYEKVRNFYKKLKKYDKVHNTSKAKEFKNISEELKHISVPYQELREKAKNHENTKQLIREYKGFDVYISLVDGDTVSFNEIFSAYIRIHQNSKNTPPTVMSTGYKYKETGYDFASEIDRDIRVLTAKHIPLGIYYPEPNTCILVPSGNDNIESFINKNKKIKKGNLELPCLIKNIQQNRKGSTFIFSDEKPLITTVPDRCKLTRTHKTPILFSSEFMKNASPTINDFKYFKQVSQSHFHKKNWYDSLFINGGISVKENSIKYCISLISKIRNNIDKDKAIINLKKHISPDIVKSISEASNNVNQYIDKLYNDHLRKEDEERALNVLNNNNIELSNLSRDEILIFAQFEYQELQSICSNKNVMEMIYNKEIDLESILNSTYRYPISEILKLCEKDPLHLKFMELDDPTDFVYENSDDEYIIEFGIDNYDIDIDWIREQLYDEREDGMDCAALQDFNAIIDRINEEKEEKCDDYDEEKEVEFEEN